MNILEITNYTAGGCGVGMRVIRESKLLAEKGHNVTIFSTNKVKGSDKLCSSEEVIDGVKIKRFHAKRLGGESYMKWDFSKEAIKLKPDVIIAHAYRHLHTTLALKIAKKINCRVLLVTHAPFGREKTRNWFENLVVDIYDALFGKKKLKEFDKIITITKWEEKYLEDLGISKSKIVYIPNGVDEVFFGKTKQIKSRPSKLVYTGRISKIKQLESVILSLINLKEGWKFNMTGPADSDYFHELNKLISKNNLNSKISINSKTYNKKEQISLLDNSDVFILPSKSEGMPQTLVEAMARGKIVIGSDNLGNKELISNGKNGFLFKNGDSKSLYKLLEKISNMSLKTLNEISKNARKTAENFHWNKLIIKLEKVISH